MKSEGLDHWRNFFRSANVSIFEIIDHAISVAGTDHPEEFHLLRGQIVEKVYSCRWSQCCSHNHSELASNENPSEKESLHGNAGNDLRVIGGSKDSEVEVLPYDPQKSKYSYSEAEALTAEIDEENENIQEVYRIKEIIQNEDESQGVLLDSLRRLQLMDLSFEMLKNTEIGKPVNRLHKHKSIQIRQLAQSLIQAWKIQVDKWFDSEDTIAASEPQSLDSNPSGIEEECGLPQPPLDIGAFTPQFPMELSFSRFFEGIDEEGNLENNMEIEMNIAARKCHRPKNFTKERMLGMDDKWQLVKQVPVFKPIEARPSDIETLPQNSKKESEPMISQRTDLQGGQNTTLIKKEQPSKNQQEIKETEKKGDAENARRQQEYNAKWTEPATANLSNLESYKNLSSMRPPADKLGQFKCLEKNTIQEKFEATTRKLKQDYQQFEFAKRQRTTQLIDVKDLPKPVAGPKNPNIRQKKQKWWRRANNGN
ncbi:hypothetical protein SLEP1_g52286 [Rubroshorea leprosula]|uniref:TFIIS N-terminal domain-containing protein n=1 Tax=Rubroshorea leprosula TaxID=152421 RepID=A0AAV5M5U5_9ROSI|nr:hypothetical protein SLEP1_g52286 [Rubroshorea leprosula]